MSRDLPEGFEDLAPALDWALPTERGRHMKRVNSDIAELNAVYALLMSRADDIMAHIGRYRVEDLPAPSHTLYLLALSLAEVSPAVENFGQPEVPDSYDTRRFIFHQ